MKRRGFTILELMLVLLILGILVGIGYPNFEKAYQNYKFTEEVSYIYDLILKARNRSLVSKSCQDIYPAYGWRIEMRTSGSINLQCLWKEGNLTQSHITDTWHIPSDYTLQTLAVSHNTTDLETVTNQAIIDFWPEALHASIQKDTDSTIYDRFKLTLKYDDVPQTICLHRIQNFPTLHAGSNDCL